MRSPLLFAIIALNFFTPSILAKFELRCLVWDLISTSVGHVCHITAEAYDKGEAQVVSKIEEAAVSAANDTANFVKFSFETSPITLTVNWIVDAYKNGVLTANKKLGAKGQQADQVVIGFGEEVANMAVQIVSLTDWNDAAACMIGHALNVTRSARRSLMPRAPVSRENAASIAHTCLDQTIFKPSPFNITGPNKVLGMKMANYMALLSPYEEAEGAWALAAGDDIKGTMVVKAGETKGAFWSSEDEARTALDELSNENAVEECRVCELEPPLTASIPEQLVGRRIYKRVNPLALCCLGPSSKAVRGAGEDVKASELKTSSGGQPKPFDLPTKTPERWDLPASWVQDGLKKYKIRDPMNAKQGLSDLKNDIRTRGTSVIKVSKAMDLQHSLQDALKEAREILSNSEEAKKFDVLDEAIPNLRRTEIKYNKFAKIWSDPKYQRLAAWSNEAEMMAKQVVMKMKNIPDDWEDYLDVEVKFCYTSPLQAGDKSSVLGLHLDDSMFAMLAGDQPGFISFDPSDGKFYRAALHDGLQYIEGRESYDVGYQKVMKEAQGNGQILNPSATLHTVFSEEMDRKGRVTVLIYGLTHSKTVFGVGEVPFPV